MHLDQDKARRASAAARALIIAAAGAAASFGLVSAEKSAAVAALATALLTFAASFFIRSGLAPVEDPSLEEVSDEVTNDPYEDPKIGLSE